MLSVFLTEYDPKIFKSPEGLFSVTSIQLNRKLFKYAKYSSKSRLIGGSCQGKIEILCENSRILRYVIRSMIKILRDGKSL